MLRKRLVHAALGALALLLAGSALLNFHYYAKARAFYAELNRVRLDPLGLRSYPEEAAPGRAPRVVFYGDSRAAAWPAPPLPGVEFVNRGLGAETSAQSLGRYPRHVAPLAPAVVVIQVGVNDLKAIKLLPEDAEAIVARCKDNIRALVEAAQRGGARVVLTTIFRPGEPAAGDGTYPRAVTAAIDEVNRYLATLAGERVAVIDAARLLANGKPATDGAYATDALHVNGAAYAALNRELALVLRAWTRV